MSARAALDLPTLPRDQEQVKPDEYLSDVSPRHKPWDVHRAEADAVREVYAEGPTGRHRRYATRVAECSQVLEFARDPPVGGKKQKLKLKTTWFCRVRHCPVCQWRRSLMWQAKVYRALPQLMADYPDTRFLFLTLTVLNCEIHALRRTLATMGRAWIRLTHLRAWPAIGWVRAVEITRAKDGRAHPHYHVLLMVPPAYFQDGYLKQHEWATLWQQSLRVNYRPVVDVRAVKPDFRGRLPPDRPVADYHIWGAVVEVLKYSVKVSDMIRDHEWFLQLVDQLHKTRAVAVGGVLKKYIRDRKKEDLTAEPGEEPIKEDLQSLYFGWKQPVQRYRLLNLEKGLVLVNGQRRV
jgi:plasmid rolling circle replication initiator protein Rep